MGRVLAAIALLGVGAIALPASSACGLTNDCQPGDPPICTSATTFTECIGGEGSYHRLDDTCPTETTCDATRATVDSSPCFGSPLGGACTTDYSCDYNLHCENKVCIAPPRDAVAACAQAQVVTLTDSGTADVDLALLSDVAPFEQSLGGTCQFGKIALFRIAEHTQGYAKFTLTSLDPGVVPASSLYPAMRCDRFFYPRAPSTDWCAPPPPYASNYLATDRTFLVAFAPGTTATTVHLRLTAE